MKHIRLMVGALALVGLICLGACAPSAVNQGISDANTACQNLVPSGESTAQSTLKGGAANTATAVSGYVNQACQGVAQAAANEGTIDVAVSGLDSLWESIFGTNTPAAPAASTPAPAATPAPVASTPTT